MLFSSSWSIKRDILAVKISVLFISLFRFISFVCLFVCSGNSSPPPPPPQDI